MKVSFFHTLVPPLDTLQRDTLLTRGTLTHDHVEILSIQESSPFLEPKGLILFVGATVEGGSSEEHSYFRDFPFEQHTFVGDTPLVHLKS